MLIELTIDKIVYGGDGIGTYNGVKVFVPYSAPQDRLLVSITTKKKDYYIGRIREIIEPSPLRQNPPCIYFSSCGGCNLQHLSYNTQLVVKKLIANETLQRVGKIFIPVANPPKAPSEWHYRNKTQYPLAPPLKIGYFRSKTHQVIDIEECLLHPEPFDRIRSLLKNLINDSKETVYDEIKHSGNLRHIIIRQGFNTGEYLLILVTRTNRLRPFVYKELTRSFPEIVGIVQNINPSKTNRILGDKFYTLYERDYYFEKILNKKFKVSAESFFQVNTLQTEHIAKIIRKFLAPNGTEHVLDLFSGVGTFSIILAESVGQVSGVEMSQTAVSDARENLKLNSVQNVEFFCETVEQGVKRFKRIDSIILDPPRKGCSNELIQLIVDLKPKRIVYISCNPATLARDLGTFDQLSYETTEIDLIDLFPQTFHIEAVANLVPKA
jgi:23S rRNA (uracil1939-C5)-methyltransferase